MYDNLFLSCEVKLRCSSINKSLNFIRRNFVFIKFKTQIYLFRGIVAVSMDMLQLDINQCPDWYYEPNAFKNSHKCDVKSSYVS